MEKIIEYRGIAAKLKREAQCALLPQVQRLKLAGAQRWEALADELEMVVLPSLGQQRRDWIF
jgi:hypothetical protein